MGHYRTAAVSLLALLAVAASPASQSSDPFPALRARLVEVLAELDAAKASLAKLEAENASLREELAKAKPAAIVNGVAKPTSTFASRVDQYLGRKTLYDVRTMSAAKRDELRQKGKAIDDAIAASGLPDEIRARLHEGSIPPGATREIVEIVAPYHWGSVVETANTFTGNCGVWAPGVGGGREYRVTMSNGIVTVVGDR